MKISAKRISKLKKAPDWGPSIMREVHYQLGQDNTVLRLAKGIVSDWDHKPRFRTRVDNLRGQLTTVLQATGKWAKIWNWVSQGTKGPYKIRAKNAPFLMFRSGYKPRTTPKGRTATFGGPGVATGSWNKKQEVTHPGIEARDFEGLIRNQYAQTFSKIIRKAIKDGARMARRGAVRITYRASAHTKWKQG